MDWHGDLINAKYHLSVAKRLFDTYAEYSEKRVLVGVISESAKAASHLIRAFLIKDGLGCKNHEKNIRIFVGKVAPKYMDDLTRENIFRAIEVEKAQKKSYIEFVKNDKIILLIGGKYRFLTAKRLREFVESVSEGISRFPTGIKR